MNAREEILKHTKGLDIRCIYLEYRTLVNKKEKYLSMYLLEGYCGTMFDDFLRTIDFEYKCYREDKYKIRGTIWYTDGSWSERRKVMNIECWVRFMRPEIPDILKIK